MPSRFPKGASASREWLRFEKMDSREKCTILHKTTRTFHRRRAPEGGLDRYLQIERDDAGDLIRLAAGASSSIPPATSQVAA